MALIDGLKQLHFSKALNTGVHEIHTHPNTHIDPSKDLRQCESRLHLQWLKNILGGI